NGPYATNYQSGAYKADEAFRRGAGGIITLVMEPASSEAWRGALRGANRARTLTPGAADLEFSGAINHDTALVWAAAAGLDMQAMPNLGDGAFKAVDLTGVTLSVSADETIDTLVTHNLLARI